MPQGLIGTLIAINITVMRIVAQLLRDMVSAGVVADYAVSGAVAQMRYTEAVLANTHISLRLIPHGTSRRIPL